MVQVRSAQYIRGQPLPRTPMNRIVDRLDDFLYRCIIGLLSTFPGLSSLFLFDQVCSNVLPAKLTSARLIGPMQTGG